MKNFFCLPEHRSVADLVKGIEMGFSGNSMIITRINVPIAHRGKGIGSRLLNEICKEADNTGTTLYLEIQESGGLTYEQLKTWYMKRGFKQKPGYFKRAPVISH